MRFSFGQNWKNYSSVITAERVQIAVEALATRVGDLRGKSFLDIGSGSGLHSLAAIQLGVSKIVAFDYDPDAVECTRKVSGERANVRIERGDVLDARYMESLGQFDVVYSWGVLHHTGRMWDAIANAAQRVAPGGTLEIAIYNDQGFRSKVWKAIKWLYNAIPPLRWPMIAGYILFAFTRRPSAFVSRWRAYQQHRGMSQWYDIVDWLGGYPFEVASRESVTKFLESRGFAIRVTRDAKEGSGCNEFVAVLTRTSQTCDRAEEVQSRSSMS